MAETAGYSKTPLIKKLGLPPKGRAVFVRPPEDFFELLGPFPIDLKIGKRLTGAPDYIHVFSERARLLHDSLPRAVGKLPKHGVLWLSWPKKSSGLNSDLDENQIRRAGLAASLVDIKVCAVDETWSGLKFMYRRKDR